jgi:eukaryotic-like serine/threonine-protein kinase
MTSRKKDMLETSSHADGSTSAPTIATSQTQGAMTHELSDDLLAPRYTDVGLLGVGGMGEVRLWRDAWLGRKVAVKSLVPERRDQAESVARFRREARVQAQLEHPSIVPVYDRGLDDSGREIFTMRRIDGRTLGDVLKEGEESVSSLLGIFRQVCLVVDYAHSRGVIHRDLKPDNILVGDYGEIYVLDWGLAKLLEKRTTTIDAPKSDTERTVAGQILGTPGYMAPEQIGAADDCDERSDVYALGAILFEILCGEPLHQGRTVSVLIQSTLMGDRRSLADRAPERDIGPELDTLVMRATAIDPRERFDSARALADAVEAYLDGQRDSDARRELAARHLQAAVEAAEEARGGNPEARQRALREAGRALILAPDERAGLQIAVSLLTEVPKVTPHGVDRAIERSELAEVREGIRHAKWIFVAFVVAAMGVPLWLGVRSVIGVAIVAAPITLAAALAFLAGHGSMSLTQTRATAAASIVLAVAAASAASGFVGPFVVAPPLLIALTVASIVFMGRKIAPLFVAAGVLAFLVPVALEWEGVVARNYTFEDSQMKVASQLIDLPETPVRVALILIVIGAVLGASHVVFRVVSDAAKLRRQLQMQIWHLREMAGLSEDDSEDS